MMLPNVVVKPKVSLDDENNKRGYELTITGTGFNKAAAPPAYVLKWPECGSDGLRSADRRRRYGCGGESLGSGTVGSDHKFVVTAEVTGGSKGDFSPGETNYICIRDDNSPTGGCPATPTCSILQHSIAVEPSDVASVRK